jgi:hypothetical protein
MSESHLPDNPQDWPDDPHAILGVNVDADLRQVRKAYAALIRIYKPERFPEEFRRVRDAYEAIKELLALREETGAEPRRPEEAPAEEGEAAGAEAAEAEAARLSLEQELRDAWEPARMGDRAVAYRRLVEMERRAPGREETCLRLYWLLSLWPELDRGQDACAWLVSGLKRSGLQGRLMELYGMELADRAQGPGLAMSAELLECDAAPDRLADLAAMRWSAAPRVERSWLIAADLEKLEPRIRDDESSRFRLLSAALDHLAWDISPVARNLRDACRKKIEEIAAHDHRLAGSLARCDLLFDLARDRGLLVTNFAPRSFLDPLYELVPDLWTCSLDRVRTRVMALLGPWIERPAAGLEILDRLHRRARAVLHQLGAAIGAMYEQSPCSWAPRDPARTAGRTARFLEDFADFSPTGYDAVRPILLRICTSEGITVREFGELLFQAGTDAPQTSSLAERIADDAPLHYLCQATLTFWF